MAEIPQLLVHEHDDNVGVVVVEGLTAGTDMLVCVTHDNSTCLLYTSPSPRDRQKSRMPSSA